MAMMMMMTAAGRATRQLPAARLTRPGPPPLPPSAQACHGRAQMRALPVAVARPRTQLEVRGEEAGSTASRRSRTRLCRFSDRRCLADTTAAGTRWSALQVRPPLTADAHPRHHPKHLRHRTGIYWSSLVALCRQPFIRAQAANLRTQARRHPVQADAAKRASDFESSGRGLRGLDRTSQKTCFSE